MRRQDGQATCSLPTVYLLGATLLNIALYYLLHNTLLSNYYLLVTNYNFYRLHTAHDLQLPDVYLQRQDRHVD